MQPNRRDEILELLRRLTSWQRASGQSPEGEKDVASTGESAAAIDDLKEKLNRLGARYHWSEKSREYQLDDIAGDAGDIASKDA